VKDRAASDAKQVLGIKLLQSLDIQHSRDLAYRVFARVEFHAPGQWS
jgi:hypothetical protein